MGAEAALAAAHAGPRVKLDTIKRGMACPYGGDYLGLANAFAAAYNTAIGRIFFDEVLGLVGIGIPKPGGAFQPGVKIGFFGQLTTALLEEVFNIFANGWSCGKPGALDAGHLDKVFYQLTAVNIEIAAW